MTQKETPGPTPQQNQAHPNNTRAHSGIKFSARQQRVIDALAGAPQGLSREAVDRIAGASNGPDVVRRLRWKLGNDAIDMHTVEVHDRDGKVAHPGRYTLTAVGRRRLHELGMKGGRS